MSMLDDFLDGDKG